MKSKIIYVTRIENEETDGQYPEHMIRIQEAQGYCFYLNMTVESLYEEVEAKVSIYEKAYNGLWKIINVCNGKLYEFELRIDGSLVYKGELISDLIDKSKRRFQEEQEQELEQIRRYEEAERLRQEKNRQEQEERARLEEEKRKQKDLDEQKAREEKQRREAEELNNFLKRYPKCARVYYLLKELKSIKSVFASDQGNGKSRNYSVEIEINTLKINKDKHRIEIFESNWEKVYIYILEGDFCKIESRPGTGVPYKVFDYIRFNNVEHHFETAVTCVFKESNNDVECSAPEISCQFLANSNVCVCEKSCPYQQR